MASENWRKLLHRWREWRRERGLPLEEEEPPVSPPSQAPVAGEVWFPVFIASAMQSVESVRQVMQDLESYGLDAGVMSDFITSGTREAAETVSVADERMWQDFDRMINAERYQTDEEVSRFAVNDRARFGVFSARIARDHFHIADLSFRALSSDYRQEELRGSVFRFLSSSSESEIRSGLQQIVQSFQRLPDLVSERWSEPLNRLGVVRGQIDIDISGSWGLEAMIQDYALSSDLARSTLASVFPMVSTLGPVALPVSAGIAASVESAARVMDETESRQTERRTEGLFPDDEKRRRLAGFLIGRFGKRRILEARRFLDQCDRLVGVLISLSCLRVRKAHFRWDALLKEVVFDTLLHQLRSESIRFVSYQVLPVLERLEEIGEFLTELDLEDVDERFHDFLDDLSEHVGRAMRFIDEIGSEQRGRFNLLSQFVERDYRNLSKLIRFRRAIRRAMEIVDEVLATPEVDIRVPEWLRQA